LSVSPSCHVSVDVVSSDIYDKDREKRDYARSISRMNTTRFRSVQSLSKSNRLTSSIAVKKLVAHMSCGMLLI
jgi:hypothetical protein